MKIRLPFSPSLLLFPPRCALCREVVPIGLAACGDCIKRITAEFAALPRCPVCQKPTPGCICRGDPLFFSRSVSVFLYTAETAPLLALLKSGDATTADLLAARMADCYHASGLPIPDAIAFVPAVEGRYNQAAALGNRLGELLGRKVLPHPLIRHQNSRVQHTLSYGERQKNAVKSYDRNGTPFVSGRVLLVDDIITTGATLSRCAALLLQSGASEVFCLTAATTPLVRGESHTIQESGGTLHAFE